ncbi:hypothetical protein B2G71_14200 [Novosphingobium sp. PC22D]|uniref:peptidylprolyl isomerase n=1 Tax=Novosphingobium sp. PC22D TaxID=1962403 RepID=UPI000BF120C3|nr:peptidylprolyl isomerase [Novosphingobium sp. PC22D]PEQ11933.1 hypothetical protein B2G71_14200 [Novosphingobium sp. PC22D]
MKRLVLLAVALAAPVRLAAQSAPLNVADIVAAAPPAEWRTIAPEDLLVMDLAPDVAGKPRRVVIQLLPAPFSQGWVENIRTLAKAHWYDGNAIVRAQDNYVVQWGDPASEDETPDGKARGEAKPLPEGLRKVPESNYVVDRDTLTAISAGTTANEMVENMASDAQAYLAGHDSERIALISIDATQTERTRQGWHERDSYATWVEFWQGWPIANAETGRWVNEDGEPVARPENTQRHGRQQQGITFDPDTSVFWPVHCYGYVGVGRNVSPDTGSGAELYAVIGHAPRHLDRNIAVVGRVIEGIEHLSTLPRGTGPLGFYETPREQVAIPSMRLGNEVPGLPAYQYLDTASASFAAYLARRANRKDEFFIQPAGGVDICNVPVPIRRVPGEG